MKFLSERQPLIYGSLISGVCVGLNFLLVHNWLRNSYYYSVLFALEAALGIALAWFIYLTKDNLLQGYKEKGQNVEKERSPLYNDEDELFDLLHHGLYPSASQSRRDIDLSSVIQKALLWSALELGMITILIYRFWGIGASYYI